MSTLAYLSGPTTGHLSRNLPAFIAAAQQLRNRGFAVLVSTRVTADPAGAAWTDCVRADLANVALRAELVVVLPEWECSREATLEVRVAQQVGVPVIPLAVALRRGGTTGEPTLVCSACRATDCANGVMFCDEGRRAGFLLIYPDGTERSA